MSNKYGVDQTEVTKGFKTEVSATNLELCAGLLEQLARHIRDGHFYTEWDHGKGWYFDESDVDKNVFMVYRELAILIEDSVKEKNAKDKKGKLIVHKDMIDYVRNDE